MIKSLATLPKCDMNISSDEWNDGVINAIGITLYEASYAFLPIHISITQISNGDNILVHNT